MIVKSCFEQIPSKADVCFLCIVGFHSGLVNDIVA